MGIFLRSARDFWRESFFLMVFNIITSLAVMPGFLLLTYAVTSRQLVLVGAGGLLLLAWPFSTFGLFHTAAQVVDGGSIHFRTFFSGGRHRLGLAYRWGAVNMAVLGVLTVNAFFYVDPDAPFHGTWMGSFLGAFFMLAAFVWTAGQACFLAILATGDLSSLRAGWRVMTPMIISRPGTVVAVAAVSGVLFAAGFAILPLGLLLAFALIAVLACRMAADLADLHPKSASRTDPV